MNTTRLPWHEIDRAARRGERATLMRLYEQYPVLKTPENTNRLMEAALSRQGFPALKWLLGQAPLSSKVAVEALSRLDSTCFEAVAHAWKMQGKPLEVHSLLKTVGRHSVGWQEGWKNLLLLPHREQITKSWTQEYGALWELSGVAPKKWGSLCSASENLLANALSVAPPLGWKGRDIPPMGHPLEAAYEAGNAHAMALIVARLPMALSSCHASRMVERVFSRSSAWSPSPQTLVAFVDAVWVNAKTPLRQQALMQTFTQLREAQLLTEQLWASVQVHWLDQVPPAISASRPRRM